MSGTDDRDHDRQYDLTERQLRTRRWLESYASAALAGVVYAVLAIVALVLLSGYPRLEQSGAELTAWFEDAGNRTRLLAGLTLNSISAIAFLWFVAVIRRGLGRREDQFFGTVYLGPRSPSSPSG